VVQGNSVTDAFGQQAVFYDSASVPTNLPTIRTALAAGLATGTGTSSADAEQAYVQAKLRDDEVIFLVIPEALHTPEMRAAAAGMATPVWRLRRPLYGLTFSGRRWSEHLESILSTKLGYKPLPNSPQSYIKIQPSGKLTFLTVYVDDCIMTGACQDEEWARLREHVTTSPPEPCSRILGMDVVRVSNDTIQLEMSNYISMALDAFQDAGGSLSGKHVAFPYKQIPPQATKDPSLSAPGRFAPRAASLLMRLLYCARCCRGDIQYSVCTLSRFVTRWTVAQDQQLTHLFNYLASTRDLALTCRVLPSDLDSLCIHIYPDADLSGSSETSKSTSGCWCTLEGDGGSVFALEWYSKLQTSTAVSTPEAELVSLSKALREAGLPLQELWSVILQRTVRLVIHEDNMSTIQIVNSGYSQALRHVSKTQRISIGFCHERCCEPDVDLRHISSNEQCGDLLTKGLDGVKHQRALELARFTPLNKKSSSSSSAVNKKSSSSSAVGAVVALDDALGRLVSLFDV